jgi:hypothetical protein
MRNVSITTEVQETIEASSYANQQQQTTDMQAYFGIYLMPIAFWA